MKTQTLETVVRAKAENTNVTCKVREYSKVREYAKVREYSKVTEYAKVREVQ